MKRLLVAFLVLVALGAMIVPVASAATMVRFTASGTLNSVNTNTGVLTVHVKHGTRPLVPYYATNVNFQTSADTKFFLCMKSTLTCSKTQITNLLAGDTVSLAGVIRTDGTFAALSVTAFR